MYEERNEKFTLKDIILQILFIALFVFLLIWLFPTKGYVNQKVDPLLDTIFNMNIMSMKDAAKSYYTLSRLPQNVGDKTKMTLREMLEEKILLPFTDKYGKECDVDESYVEITKEDEEYIMKVNLKCSQQEDYIIVHMGCYDYCQTTICENKDEEIVDKNDKPVDPVIPDPDPEDPDPKPKPEKKYECEYVLNKDGYYTPWTAWSDWTENKITVAPGEEKVHEVDTEVRTSVEEKKVLTGYKYTEIYDGNKPIYENKTMVIGTNKITTCLRKGYISTTTTTITTSYGEEQYMGTFETPVQAQNTAIDRYELVSAVPISCDYGDCSVKYKYVYKWYAKKVITTKVEDTVNGEIGCLESQTSYEPITGVVKILVGYGTSWRKDPVYDIQKVNVSTTYYRDRTRTFVSGSSEKQWNTCNNSSLINSGWVFTGNKREVK